MRSVLLSFFILISFSLFAQFNMSAHIEQNISLSPDVFLEQFPYKSYLKTVPYTDFKALQTHRKLLNQADTVRHNLGDEFLYALGDNFLKLYPVIATTQQLNAKISIGEKYLGTKAGITGRDAEVFQLMGYFLLGQVAQKIEGEFKAGKFDLSEPTNEAIINRLAKNKVFLSIDKSDWDKMLAAVQKGQWSYLWDRFNKKLSEWQGEGTSKTKLALGNFKSKTQQGVEIYAIKEAGNTVGYSVWMQTPSVKATYFASGKAYDRYSAFAKKVGNSDCILATTGGFTNAQHQPEGLTIDNGKMVNAVLKPERHALVIVEKDGNMRVANLKHGVWLPNLQRQVDPLSSLRDYSALIAWAKGNGVTLFQTQLLAHNHQPLIEISKAPNQLRERRLLVMVSDNNGTQHNVIFSVNVNKNLAVITEEIFDVMRTRGKKIEAILNFDVGSYNILRVMDAAGKEVAALRGPVSIYKATNLVVFYK
ncbi:MAG: hypothetical protein JNL70_01970 [Saprospiraceae bacterium]|nr:hypothetical protein [Saprospiraceae bacterium]